MVSEEWCGLSWLCHSGYGSLTLLSSSREVESHEPPSLSLSTTFYLAFRAIHLGYNPYTSKYATKKYSKVPRAHKVQATDTQPFLHEYREDEEDPGEDVHL